MNNNKSGDSSFHYHEYLHEAVDNLNTRPDSLLEQAKSCTAHQSAKAIFNSANLPEAGIGDLSAAQLLAPVVLGEAAYLDSSATLAHMDPPTPWITWAIQLWNARLNQNLLHPATSPFAKEAEKTVVDWLVPFFGMDGGHMCAGSTIANLTALWAARDLNGAKTVIASKAAHISVKKAANILGLEYIGIDTDEYGRLDLHALPQSAKLREACLVLTAGTTGAGAIDPLQPAHIDHIIQHVKWLHIDAAWAGPLCLSDKYKHLLSGIEQADSIAISAHKWLYQPKDSALVLFKDTKKVNPAISEGSSYLAAPNVGIQGSRGASAVALLGTLLAWGKHGLVQRIEKNMAMSATLTDFISNQECNANMIKLALFTQPITGVLLFRPEHHSLDEEASTRLTQRFISLLPKTLFSTFEANGILWLRCVAANPNADIDEIIRHIKKAHSNLVNTE